MIAALDMMSASDPASSRAPPFALAGQNFRVRPLPSVSNRAVRIAGLQVKQVLKIAIHCQQPSDYKEIWKEERSHCGSPPADLLRHSVRAGILLNDCPACGQQGAPGLSLGKIADLRRPFVLLDVPKSLLMRRPILCQ